MRRDSRKDANHGPIVKDLKALGFDVVDLSRVGGGCPDILVAWSGGYALLELKTAAGKLNKKQKKFHAEFGGRIFMVRSVVEALAALGVTRGE